MRLYVVALALVVAVVNAAPISRCDEAIAKGSKTFSALEASLPAFFAACLATIDGRADLCADSLGLVCAASAAQGVAIRQVVEDCTSSLPSLGCGKTAAGAQKFVATLTATCGAALATCRKEASSHGPIAGAACIAGVAALAGEIEVAALTGQTCGTFQACNNCSAAGSGCSPDFKMDHPECRQFGPDVGCCAAKDVLGCSTFGDKETPVQITAFGQDFCCPQGATLEYPCGAPTPPPVRYKCVGGTCVVNETGVPKSDCEAACGSHMPYANIEKFVAHTPADNQDSLLV